MKLDIAWVDAFTDRAFAGNSAAVCRSASQPPAAWMQALASEFGISETAFVVPAGGPGEFTLRWFTPTTEVDLCGHATLAATHVLVETGQLAAGQAARFATRSGELVATARADGSVELDLPADPVTAAPVPPAVAHLVPEAVAAGTSRGFCVVELPSAGHVARFAPGAAGLAAIAMVDQLGLLLSAPGDEAGVDYVLRFFAPKVGIDEDPATGSAHCPLGPYWSEQLGRPTLEARQLSARGAAMTVTPAGDRVKVAGRAVTVLHGTGQAPESSPRA